MKPDKVLVVDDSKLMHRMYEVMLRDYTLVDAYDGREAVDALRQQDDIDLVLLDVNMPNMNGLEVLEELARDDRVHPPVVIVSTEGREEDTQRGLEAGAVAYIKKPFQSDQLMRIIESIEG